ncbi:MAG: glycosyltransferase family 9 protein [Ignavibacteriaceae bacterium]
MKKIEIYLRKLLLGLLLSFRFISKPAEEDYQDENSKILFIRLNRIGDALVVTPLLHEIRKNVKSKIYLLADKKNYFSFNNNHDIDQVIIFEKGLKGIFSILKFIKVNNINTIVDLHDDVSTTVSFIIAFAKASNKFGLAKGNEKIYTRTVKKLDPGKYHVVERILETGKLFKINYKKEEINIRYSPTVKSSESSDRFLKEKGLTGKFLIGVNISAGSMARFWGVKKYKNLFKYLSGFDVNSLLITSPKDLRLAEQISENKIQIYYSEKFDEFAAMISKLDLLFTPDTAAVHLASTFNIPVFGIYVRYKTGDMIWSPYSSKFESVVTEEPNLENISFEEVKTKLDPFLKSIRVTDEKTK